MVPGELDESARSQAGHDALREPALVLLTCSFDAAGLKQLRFGVREQAESAGLPDQELQDFVLAAHELAINAVVHGGGSGQLVLSLVAGCLICEVSDHGPGIDDVPSELPAPNVPGGRGLWLAEHLTDGLAFVKRPDGVTAAVSVRVPAWERTAGRGSSLDG